MFSKKHNKRHWEKVRDYLAISFFEDIPRPSFSTTSEEEYASSTSTSYAAFSPPPPIVLPRISPLPELIIERVNREHRHDEPEAFYDKLEAKIKKLMNNIQDASQSDDINYLDTIILMDISQDSATENENFDVNPNGHTQNATLVKDFSTETEINDTHSEPHEEDDINVNNSDVSRHSTTSERGCRARQSASSCDVKTIKNKSNNNMSHLNENEVQTNYNSNNDTSEPELSQKTDDSYEESITFTLEDNKREPHEVPNESVSIETIANVHSVPKNCTPNLLHIIGTVNLPKSPILGRSVNKKAKNKNRSNSEYSNSEDSSTSAETLHESVYSESSLEESSDMNRLDIILEEGESQFEDTRDSSSNDFEDGDVTSGPQSQNDSAPKVNSSPQNDPEAPEIMRAINKKSFRTTKFSFTRHDSDSENDIFAKPTLTEKKHSEIHVEDENHGLNLNLENDVVVNINFVTSTPKSTTFNYSVHETDAASPEYVDKSQQCEIQSSPNNTRKRRANLSVKDAHSVSGDGDNSNWESLKKNFFIGVPKIYRLCNCKDHSCT